MKVYDGDWLVEVTAFAGMTSIDGGKEIPAFAGIGVRSPLIPKIYKDKK